MNGLDRGGTSGDQMSWWVECKGPVPIIIDGVSIFTLEIAKS